MDARRHGMGQLNAIASYLAAALLLLFPFVAVCAPDFIIVSPPDLRDVWETYAEQRQAARPDLEIAVTGTDVIYATYPFGPGLACRNAAESVHAYIREAAHAGATYFLLGGMWLDTRSWHTNELYFATGERLSLSNCVPGICARPYTGTKGGDIPSDMFYACLDDIAHGSTYPWDPSGDGIYLAEDEFLSCDCVPDVAVGRFVAVPYAYGGTNAPSPRELVLAYADKVARGMGSAFSGLHRMGVASAEMIRTYPNDSRDFGRPAKEMYFYDDVPNLWSPSHPAPVADTECAVREMFRTLVAPNWPVLEVEALHGTGPAFASRYPDLSSAISAFFANDMLYSTCRSHGTATATSGIGITRTLYANATGLTLFGEFCVPCLAGSVDVTRREGGRTIVMPSMGMAATCSPFGGCLAGVFNSRYGWTSEFYSINVSDGISGSLAQLLARRLFVYGDATFGLAHLHARQDFVAEYTLQDKRVYALCEQMFYGDPTLGFPPVEKTIAWTGDACMTADVAVVTAHFNSDAEVAGTGLLKVMDELICDGTNLMLAVGGGVGRAVTFSGTTAGMLTLSGPSFYLGGTSNCVSVAVRGGGKVIDVTRRDGALVALTVDGDGTANATNVLRCSASGAFAALGTIPVRSSALVLETAEGFGAGGVPLAAVTNGALRLSPGPMRAWPEGTEHLAREVRLSDSSFAVDAEATVFFGMRDSSGLNPFRLCVDGSCALASSTPGGVVGLVGTTTIALADGANLAMGLRLYDADVGGLVLAGGGAARASADALAGSVEVREGAALELAGTPLPAVTTLVVRAGSTLRIPSDPTGLHMVLTGTGRLVLEDGAVVEDLGGNVLTGRAMNGMFFEPGAALCWRGNAETWSGAEAWYDVVTGVACPWANGRIAVFPSAAAVTNDCTGVIVKGVVFDGDVSIAGEGFGLVTGFIEVPSNRTVSIAVPLSCTDDVTKAGEGTLVLRGPQAISGGLVARVGTLELDGVVAPSVTNLVTEAGAGLALRGESALPDATACNTISAGTLRLASERPASLEVGRFIPPSQFVLPAGVTVRAACEYGFWRMTVNGRLECLTSPAMAITSWIDGTGTVRTAGLWTDTTAYARFSFCRVEMAPGTFQVLGNPGTGIMRRQYKNFLFDGVTFAPDGGDVHVTNSDLPEGLVTMCVNTNGVVFDTLDAAAGIGRTISFDDPCATNLFFYGPGDVTKVGPGTVRFAVNDDLHEGRTLVQGGTYSVSTWSSSSGFHVTGDGSSVAFAGEYYEGDVSVGAGSVFDLSDPAVTLVATTNFHLAAGATLKVCVTSDGCDLVYAQDGTCVLPADGDVALDVTVRPDAPPGLYAAVAFPRAATSRWTGHFTVPGGQQVGLEFTSDRKVLCVRVRRAATVLYIR